MENQQAVDEVGSLSHHLQGFIHPNWCRMSSINSMLLFFGFSACESACVEEVKTLRIPIDFFPCKTVNISGRYIMFTLCSHLVGVASYGSQSYDSARRQSELIAVDCLEQLPGQCLPGFCMASQ